MIRSVAVAAMILSLSACSAYSRYAAAIIRDVDVPTQAIVRVVSRLQATVVRGRVPADSIPLWAKELRKVATLASHGVSDFAKIRPPDQHLQSDHSRLLLTITKQSAAVTAAAAAAEACVASPGDNCDQLTSTDYYKILDPIADAQVNVRWRRGDIAQDLNSHGVTISQRIP